MQPYKRRRRTRRDMIVLGGWLFADLLLGLAMLFAVANTVGAPPPEPTATPLPNYQATSEAEIAQNNTQNQQTVEALQGNLANQERAAQATQDAQATNQAMSAEQRATANAQATEDAVVAQATIDALSTEQAANQSSNDALSNDLATQRADATNVARQGDANATERAQLEAQATDQAAAGGNAQATNAALQSDLDQAQSRAATAEASSSNANQRVENAEATSDTAQNQLSRAQQQVEQNSLNPAPVTATIRVDLSGVNNGEEGAEDDARDELQGVFDKYIQGDTCRLGFVLITSNSPDLSSGVQLSKNIGRIIETQFPDVLPEPTEGDDPTLAGDYVANPGASPSGEVELTMLLSTGCGSSASLDPGHLAIDARRLSRG